MQFQISLFGFHFNAAGSTLHLFSSVLPAKGVKVAYDRGARRVVSDQITGLALGISTLASRPSSTLDQLLNLFKFNGIDDNMN